MEIAQVSVQYKGHTYSGEITLVPEAQETAEEPGQRARAPQMGSSCMQHATGQPLYHPCLRTKAASSDVTQAGQFT